MLQSHKDIFYKVACELNCIIGLREPNPLSDRWIEQSGFIAKAQNCKAKTANNPLHLWAGLVVDPFICESAFLPESLTEAKKKWKEFAPLPEIPEEFDRKIKKSQTNHSNRKSYQDLHDCTDYGLPLGFRREKRGEKKGVLQYNGCAIHTDYDLLCILPAGSKSPDQDDVFFRPSKSEFLLHRVQSLLNHYLDKPMIMHGDEFADDWDGIGAVEREYNYFFDPKRKFFIVKTGLHDPAPKQANSYWKNLKYRN